MDSVCLYCCHHRVYGGGHLIVVYITKSATNGLRVEMEQEVEGLTAPCTERFEIGCFRLSDSMIYIE
ncbi:MAG: hypothetical protein R2860_09205 [Desulfobacterales bacterium]